MGLLLTTFRSISGVYNTANTLRANAFVLRDIKEHFCNYNGGIDINWSSGVEVCSPNNNNEHTTRTRRPPIRSPTAIEKQRTSSSQTSRQTARVCSAMRAAASGSGGCFFMAVEIYNLCDGLNRR